MNLNNLEDIHSLFKGKYKLRYCSAKQYRRSDTQLVIRILIDQNDYIKYSHSFQDYFQLRKEGK